MIEVRNLSFRYAGAGREAVKDVSFTTGRGEIFGFLGPSGAGKSTTQKILTGLLKGYRGTVSVFGKDLDTLGSDYYERIGVGFEFPNHYAKLTALENLKLFQSLYRNRKADPLELLAQVGLRDDARMPVSRFSKGMKMRLGFIRAIIHDPDIIFLDEPTSGMDPVNARTIKNIILAKKQEGKTIFYTTHNMFDADELCDRVAFIVDGGIRLIDAPRELKLRRGAPKVKVEYRRNGATGSREFALERLGFNAEFLSLLQTEKIETLHTQEATLEEIFIETTGRKLA